MARTLTVNGRHVTAPIAMKVNEPIVFEIALSENDARAGEWWKVCVDGGGMDIRPNEIETTGGTLAQITFWSHIGFLTPGDWKVHIVKFVGQDADPSASVWTVDFNVRPCATQADTQLCALTSTLPPAQPQTPIPAAGTAPPAQPPATPAVIATIPQSFENRAKGHCHALRNFSITGIAIGILTLVAVFLFTKWVFLDMVNYVGINAAEGLGAQSTLQDDDSTQ